MMSFKDLSVCLIFKYLINPKSARYCNRNLPHLPLLTFCPQTSWCPSKICPMATQARWLRPSWSKRWSQWSSSSMMARHWALCWWQKTLTGSTPRGGRGSKSSKMKFCKMIPWCSEGTLFWRLCLEKFKISHCSWDTTPDPQYLTLAEFMRYFTKTTISHGCRFREI